MEHQQPLNIFLGRIANDPRIRTAHIAVFMALYYEWMKLDCPKSLNMNVHKLMELAKISSSATWHKTIIGLNEYGYIKYYPTFNKMSHSRTVIDLT